MVGDLYLPFAEKEVLQDVWHLTERILRNPPASTTPTIDYSQGRGAQLDPTPPLPAPRKPSPDHTLAIALEVTFRGEPRKSWTPDAASSTGDYEEDDQRSGCTGASGRPEPP
jgi:hypothetical protein